MTELFVLIVGVSFCVSNLYFGGKLKERYYFFKQRKSSEIVFLSAKHNSTVFITWVCFMCVQAVLLLRLWIYGYFVPLCLCFGAIIIFYGFRILQTPTSFEVSQISRNNNMNLGYGCAVWYYDNYLKKFNLPYILTRIRKFEGRQQVKLPDKLYILFPFSCKVKQYIDDTEYIERCREMTSLKTDYSGVHEREYKITVYQIFHPEGTFRCAVEYAQPLKTLRHFKDFGKMSLEEMLIEGDKFCLKLNELLRDEADSYRLCELIQFDDEKTDVHEVLYGTDSIRKFFKCGYT